MKVSLPMSEICESGYKFPGFVEVMTFTEVSELGCENGFDVLGIHSHNHPLSRNAHLIIKKTLATRDTIKVLRPVRAIFFRTRSKFSKRLDA